MKNHIKQTPLQFYHCLFWLLIISFPSQSNTYALGENFIKPSKLNLVKDNWVFHSEVKGVKIFYQLSTCEKQSVVYLKFDNTNRNAVRIAWQETYITQQVAEERTGILGEKQLILAPGVTSESDCTQIQVKECVTLAYLALPSYKADIIKVNFKNISVSNPS